MGTSRPSKRGSAYCEHDREDLQSLAARLHPARKMSLSRWKRQLRFRTVATRQVNACGGSCCDYLGALLVSCGLEREGSRRPAGEQAQQRRRRRAQVCQGCRPQARASDVYALLLLD